MNIYEKVYHDGMNKIRKYKYADILFFGGEEKTGEICITFECKQVYSIYIIFSCMEKNSEGQLIMYATKFCFFTSIGYEFIDKMNEQEIEMIEDVIARKFTRGLFIRKQLATLDKRPLIIESVCFK